MFNKLITLLQRTGLVRTAIAVAFILLMTSFHVRAQTYAPTRYWTFERSNPMLDSMNNFNMDPNYYQSPYAINTNSSSVGVGRYMTLNGSSSMIKLGMFTIDTTITVEFLFRPGFLFNMTSFFKRIDGAFEAQMGYPYISFYTNTTNYSGGTTFDELRVDLNQIGKRSYGYFMDGNWHHIVFSYNSKTGVKKIYIDGDCPDGYSKTITSGYFINNSTVNRDVILNSQSTYLKYHGDIDEIAYYNYVLPPNQIYKHYQDFTQKKHYTFAASSTSAPTPASVTAGLDINEFAPGHPSVTTTAMDQLAQYPSPRYKPGNTLMKNFNWMDPSYMGGLFQPGITTTQAVINSTIIQTELAKNFNYYFNVGSGTGQFDTAWVGAANANPSFKIGMRVFRAQINGNNPDLVSQTKPSSQYLQNSSGQFLDLNGNVTTNKIWRPTAPTSSYASDGNSILTGLNYLFTRLNRGIDLINENGEVFPFITETAALKDPVVTAAKTASGLDYQTFLAMKFKENETASYRDIFMSHPRMANAKFTEFAIDGFPPLYGFQYSEARKVNTMINNQYYPTPTIYTRWASNWRNWTTAWHGWQWVVDTRVHELALGDRLYSPFVAAGWDANEEMNIRPAQWLGFLKCLGMTGAEFYYPAFFSIGAPWPDAKNWIWQVSTPSYAQAITSRYEDYLRNGELMAGDLPNDYINPTAPGYTFNTGDLRKLVVVRKHNIGNKYAITGTIQPNTSMVGNAENSSIATIILDGQSVKFEVRRQGSTYIYDKTNASAPVFYQLDKWHEASHPSRWSTDFVFEAELFDNVNANAVIKTVVPSGTPAGDFTNYTSYVSFNAASDITYNFFPRKNAPTTDYLWVRARSKDGSTTGFSAQLDGGSSNTFGCIVDTNWVWYRFNTSNVAVTYSGLTNASHELKITATNTKIEIDKVILTSTPGAVYGNTTNPCTTAQASITAGGPLSFCQGGSVSLTASSGTSYLWSNGATAQTISVSTAGTYTVSVTTSGVGTSTSAPVTVTVYSLPTATVTAGGATTFCTGGSVTLTASAGSSYLWSPGNQTTQSITTSTAGTYYVRVTNSNGCSQNSSNTTVTVNAAPTATITPGSSTTFCQGGNVTLTASAGSSYLWSPGNQTSQSISATSGGSYNVRVTNASGCSAVSSNTTITVNSLPTATITAGGPLNIPQGGSVTLTASAGSSYLWTPGGQTTQSRTVNSGGSYTVKVTNSNGCSAISAPTVVTVTGTASISASGPTSFCQGGSVTLTANTGSSYLWSTGATSQSITTSTTGTFTVTVYNGSTPYVSPAVSVNVYSLPSASITASGPTTICNGSSVTLTSSPNSSYLWSPGGQTTQSISASTTATYNVTVANSNGCTKTATAVPVTVTNCSTTCDAPYGLITNNVASNSVTVSWTAPNTGQTDFQVKLKNVNTNAIYVATKVPSSTTVITLGVSSSTNYRWWVRSWCGAIDKSAYAGYLSFNTPVVRASDPTTSPIEMTPLYLSDEIDNENGNMTINLDENTVQIFPNPASDEASISFKTSVDEIYTVSLMELNGKIISKQKIDAKAGYNIHPFDIRTLSKGMYLVQLNSSGNSVIKKLVIQ